MGGGTGAGKGTRAAVAPGMAAGTARAVTPGIGAGAGAAFGADFAAGAGAAFGADFAAGADAAFGADFAAVLGAGTAGEGAPGDDARSASTGGGGVDQPASINVARRRFGSSAIRSPVLLPIVALGYRRNPSEAVVLTQRSLTARAGTFPSSISGDVRTASASGGKRRGT